MKTQDKNKVAIVNELSTILDQMKILAKREREIKDWIKSTGETYIETKNIVVTVKDGKTTFLDREAIVVDHGAKFLDKYLRETHYKQISVIRKKAA